MMITTHGGFRLQARGSPFKILANMYEITGGTYRARLKVVAPKLGRRESD